MDEGIRNKRYLHMKLKEDHGLRVINSVPIGVDIIDQKGCGGFIWDS